MDFGQGKVPSAQQLESVSSWSQSSKGVLLNSPNDTGVIYLIYLIYSSQHICLQVCFLRLWEGTCAVSQLPGHQAPQRPKALTGTFSFIFNSGHPANLNNIFDFLCVGPIHHKMSTAVWLSQKLV